MTPHISSGSWTTRVAVLVGIASFMGIHRGAAENRPSEIRVGVTEGDFRGADDRTLQAAVDQAARNGGGVVRIGPGRYVMRNALKLKSGVHVVGTPGQTVLVPEGWRVTRLAEDAQAGQPQIVLVDPAGFQAGDGVGVRDDRATGFLVTSATIEKQIDERRFGLSQPLAANYARAHNAQAARIFPMVEGQGVKKGTVEGLAIDGRRDRAPFYLFLDGCRAAGIYLYACQDVTIRRCTVRHYPGDGISVQWGSRGVTVEDCLIEQNNVFGIHPGSDSHHCAFRRNRSIGNGGPGVFVCVGVKDVLVANNEIRGNTGPGISIGSKDTDNVFRDNTIADNTLSGVLFRDDGGEDVGAHRNRFEHNAIVDNGAVKDGKRPACVTFLGTHRDVVFRGNTIVNTRAGGPPNVGIQAPRANPVKSEGNRFANVSLEQADEGPVK